MLDKIERELNEVVSGLQLSPATASLVHERIVKPILTDVRSSFDENHPPRLYLVGRSGHGKSSLVNVLAGKRVAEVGAVRPTSPGPSEYLVSFSGRYTPWQIIDSRGMFETTRPDDTSTYSAIEQVVHDLLYYTPDVILHTVAMPEVRAMAHDFSALVSIRQQVHAQGGVMPPMLLVLTKADSLGKRGEWPPERFFRKQQQILQVLIYLASEVLGSQILPLIASTPSRGIYTSDASYIGIVPICTSEDVAERWNNETLTELLGDYLPRSTLLHFAQAQQRKVRLRRIVTAHSQRCAELVSGTRLQRIFARKTVPLVPLLLLQVAVIGGLAYRSFSLEVAHEYFSTNGVTIQTGISEKEIARQMLNILTPGVGTFVSGFSPQSLVFTIGRSAEIYFFDSEVRKPNMLTGHP